MSMQKKLDERDFRYLQFVVGRAHGTTDEQIVKELEDPDIESPQVLYRDVHHKMEEFPAYTFVPC
jgi:uncharacterized membrane protein